MSNQILWVHNLSSVHIGCGTGTGAIDLPIIREKPTNWPYIPGSSLKGVLADHFNASEAESRRDLAQIAFGKPDSKDAAGNPVTGNSGGLTICDARLICFPVRSLFGTFAWITCPLALQRLARDLKEAGIPLPANAALDTPGSEQIYVHDLTSTALKPPQGLGASAKAALGELDFQIDQPTNQAPLRSWAEKLASWLFSRSPQDPWRQLFLRRFALVDEDTFTYLNEIETEVNYRTRINPTTGIVMKGQLWTEEALPAESILASFVSVDPVVTRSHDPRKVEDLQRTYCSKDLTLQIGANSTVGNGKSRMLFTPPAGAPVNPTNVPAGGGRRA